MAVTINPGGLVRRVGGVDYTIHLPQHTSPDFIFTPPPIPLPTMLGMLGLQGNVVPPDVYSLARGYVGGIQDDLQGYARAGGTHLTSLLDQFGTPAFSQAMSGVGGAQAITRFVGGAQALLSAHGPGEALAAIGGLVAAAAPPPYGPAIGIGISLVGSIAGSLFGADAPPPSVAGVPVEDLEATPLGNENLAALAGRIQAGSIIPDDPTVKESIAREAGAVLHAALKLMSDHPTWGVREGGPLDRRLRRAEVGTSFRAVAYYCVYAGDALGFPNFAPQLSKLIAWGAPRVQIREMLMYGYAARVKEEFDEFLHHHNWTEFHQLFSYGEAGLSADALWGIAASRLLPVPAGNGANENGGMYQYHPISHAVLAEELPLYDAGNHNPGEAPGGLQIRDTISNTTKLRMDPSTTWGRGGHTMIAQKVSAYLIKDANSLFINQVADALNSDPASSPTPNHPNHTAALGMKGDVLNRYATIAAHNVLAAHGTRLTKDDLPLLTRDGPHQPPILNPGLIQSISDNIVRDSTAAPKGYGLAIAAAVLVGVGAGGAALAVRARRRAAY